MFKTLIFSIGVIFIGLVLNSCDNKNCPNGPDNDETIKVGVLLGFIGTGTQNALETQSALNICLEDLRAYIQRNGIDAEIELYYEDTQSDTNTAKIKAQTLIDKGVRLIIGPYTSAESKVVKRIADEKNVLVVSHSAVSTSLAIPNDNLLRFVPSDTYQAEAMNAMFQYDGIMAIIPVVRNDLWSNSLVQATVSKFTINGGVTLTPQSFEPGTTDFSSVIAGVKSAIADGKAQYGIDKIAIYLISYADGTDFLAALSDAGLTEYVRIYGASAFAQSTALLVNPKALEMAYNSYLQCPVFGFDESAQNIYEPIQTRIKANIGVRASIYALAAYDILWTAVMTSLTQDEDQDFAEYKAHFIETANAYFGATGSTALDENGDRKHVYYDFWSIMKDRGNYIWEITAKYNTTDSYLKIYILI
ncbi:MAG: ABC transporter substrate-binding protein [bacterium]